ncbi:MAG: hypothetical protein KIT45_09785 [Fimbriimonadia bacterium]|nr:hypothetical protein [Fimbriimonadia bacterium]
MVNLTDKKIGRIGFRWSILLLIGGMFLSTLWGHIQLEERQMFALYYGTKDFQILVRPSANSTEAEGDLGIGPLAFATHWSGKKFYFLESGALDAKGSRVKVFDQEGKLETTIACASEPKEWMAIGFDGTIYLFGEAISVYSDKGAPKLSIQSALNNQLRQALRDGWELRKHYFVVDYAGCVYLSGRVSGEFKTLKLSPSSEAAYATLSFGVVNRKNGHLSLLSLDGDGSEVNQTVFDEHGSVVNRSRMIAFTRRSLKTYNQEQTLLRDVSIPSTSMSSIESQLNFGTGQWEKLDGRDALFLVAEPSQLRWERRGEIQVLSRYSILEYDRQGAFVGVRAQFNDPDFQAHKSMTNVWDIDREGNLYYLDFQADHLRVMKVAAR